MKRKIKPIILVVTILIVIISFLIKMGINITTINIKENSSPSGNTDFISQEKITFKYWAPSFRTEFKRMNDNYVYRELEKRTNIHIEFIGSKNKSEVEEFNLMMASNDLPDIIQSSFVSYPGGPDKAIADGIYLKLNDLIDKYAPDYKRIRTTNDEIARQTITDAGNIFSFDCIQLAEEQPWDGLVIRKDWLNDLGLSMPQTIDDWRITLTYFKEKKNAQVPFIFNGFKWHMPLTGALVGAYGTINDFYNENGNIKYGVIESGYKEFLKTMNEWYKDKLIDKDFFTRDDISDDALFTSGRAGAMFQSYGRFESYNTAGRKLDPEFQVAGVVSPTVAVGNELHFRQTNYHNKGYSLSVTTACKYPVEAVKWLNYAYTDNGFLLYNYGVEGVSWKWSDGPVDAIDKPFYPQSLTELKRHPVFLDAVKSNSMGAGPLILEDEYKVHQTAQLRNPMAFSYFTKDVMAAMKDWGQAGNDYMMPPITLTEKENEELTNIMNNVNLYVDEMNIRFITGAEPISNFDEFVEKIRKMKIEDGIRIKQEALNRYTRR